MGDLKLSGNNKTELESIVQTGRIYTEGIRMGFGLEKCTTLIMNRRKRSEGDGVEFTWRRDGERSWARWLQVFRGTGG